LLGAIKAAHEKIVGVDVLQDNRLVLTADGQRGSFAELAQLVNIPINSLEL